jgi:hypothetical protein
MMSTGNVFTPEQIEAMHKAFETVCAKLDLQPGERATEHVAITIVDLAATGVLEFQAITDATLAAVERWEEPYAVKRRPDERAA